MIRLRLLGTAEIQAPEDAQALLGQPRRLALVAFLSLRKPRGFVRRDAILPLFWEELDQTRARNALRQAVYTLRRQLGAEVLESRGGEEVTLDAERLWCDAVAFEDAVEEERFEQALELYRGELLRGFHLAEASGFVDWLEAERRRLRGLAIGAARRLTDIAKQDGRLRDSVQWARRHLELAPDDEAAAADAIRLLAESGDRTGAIRLFDTFGERLSREYDLTPSEELEGLAREIRDGRIRTVQPPESASIAHQAVEPTGPESVPRRPLYRRLVPVGVTAAAVTVLALAFAVWSRGKAQTAPSDGSVVVAVFPFSVQGDRSLRYLSAGMVDLLSTGLNGAGALRTVDPATVLAAMRSGPGPLDTERAAAISAGLGADLFVLGTVVEAGGRLRISAWLYDARGEVQGAAEGGAVPRDALFEQVNLVARDLLADRFGGTESALSGLAARTTSSLDALKAYLSAEQAFRTDRHEDVVRYASTAAELDPTFALAHYRLSTAAAWVNQPRLALEVAREATRLGGSLGARDQALLTAHLYQQERRWEEARGQLLAVLASQPDHVEAWFKLGEVYFHSNNALGRPIADAEEPFRRTLALDPGHLQAALHMGRLGAVQGNAPLVDSMLAFVRETGTQAEAELELLALRAALSPGAEGDVIDAFTSGRPAAEMNAATWSRAVFGGDIPGAARLARVSLGAVPSPEWQAVFHARLGYFALAQGRWREAWTELTRAEELDAVMGIEEKGFVVSLPFLPSTSPELDEVLRGLESLELTESATLVPGRAAYTGLHEEMRLYLLGLAYARAGDVDRARATAAELAEREGPVWPEGLIGAWVNGITAYALVAEGRTAEAFELLDGDGTGPRGVANPPAFTQAVERFLWATLGESRPGWEYGARGFDSYRHRRVHHLAFLGPSSWGMARVYAEEGRVDEARGAYRRFIDLWEKCEPPLCALRDQAIAELERLGS